MIQPTTAQIATVKLILATSIGELITNDDDIFNIDIPIPRRLPLIERLLDRELHEICINHRLAYYLENNLQDQELGFYNVDLEYNRYYGNQKILNTGATQVPVRPDIIVHTRMNDQVEQQHYLVVEAKKAEITPYDIVKVRAFISDDNYNYLFGLTISYCSSETHVLANLYFFNGTEIVFEEVNRLKP
jgi:hypothetical protein